jgi:hypothetical protein
MIPYTDESSCTLVLVFRGESGMLTTLPSHSIWDFDTTLQ